LKARLRKFFKKYFEHRAVVLMYHRVVKVESDVWDIVVSPEHFEQHLQVLQATKKVVPIHELVEDVKRQKLRKNSIAITFDDGYIDNYTTARPLLEKYNLPATIFVTTGQVGSNHEFWWDELENLLLFTEKLPPNFSMSVGGSTLTFDLQEEVNLQGRLRQAHASWKACDTPPPTRRSELFLKLWTLLKPLAYAEQQNLLQQLRNWAGVSSNARESYKSINETQLHTLGQSKWLTLGVHTVTHPTLASHSRAFQQHEITACRQYLKNAQVSNADLLAYPYGDYNTDTIAVAAELGFAAAFTTQEKIVTKKSDVHQLARYQVKDMDGISFKRQLTKWLD
jgi:peptidoglycan/xylan/chitin deacetylase (PgdA/CDA1 family)